MRKWTIAWLAAAALAGEAPAAQPAGIEALFEAADRGEVARVERALVQANDETMRLLLRARIAAARGDLRPAADPRLRALAQAADPATRRAALSLLVNAAFASGDYAAAAAHGRALRAASGPETDADEREAIERSAGLAAIMAGHPPQRIEGPIAAASIPARVDRVGLPRIEMSVNGSVQEAVFDTGAGLSVLSTETARRLGVRVLEAEARVGNAVRGSVPVRIGFADRLEIAGTVLRDVPFLIIDDAQLTFPVPGGYDIKAIVGLPVMRALGRIRMAPERFSVLPDEAAARPPNLSISGNDLYLDVLVDGELVPLFVDTGANASSLGARWAEAHADRVAGFQSTQLNTAGAGGATSRRGATWLNAPLTVAGRGLVLPRLTVNLPGEGRPRQDHGVIGEDVLRAFADYTIDFRTMRLELGEPVAPPGPS